MHLVNGTGNSPSPGQPTPGVVKQDKSSGGSVDTTKTRSGPQRVRMSSGERPIGAAKGKQSDTEALCHPPPPPCSAWGRCVREHSKWRGIRRRAVGTARIRCWWQGQCTHGRSDCGMTTEVNKALWLDWNVPHSYSGAHAPHRRCNTHSRRRAEDQENRLCSRWDGKKLPETGPGVITRRLATDGRSIRWAAACLPAPVERGLRILRCERRTACAGVAWSDRPTGVPRPRARRRWPLTADHIADP